MSKSIGFATDPTEGFVLDPFGIPPRDVRAAQMSDDEPESVLHDRLGGLSAISKEIGDRLGHVQCHGALQHDVSCSERWRSVLVNAVETLDPALSVIFMAESPGPAWARSKGWRVASEGYVDRAYDRSGHEALETQER